MADLKRVKINENEQAHYADADNFTALMWVVIGEILKRIIFWDAMDNNYDVILGSATGKGLDVVNPSGLDVRVEPGSGIQIESNDGMFIVNDVNIDNTLDSNSGGANNRVDLVIAKFVEVNTDVAQRNKIDPATGIITPQNFNTRAKASLTIEIIKGDNTVAPGGLNNPYTLANAGKTDYIKLAEVTITSGDVVSINDVDASGSWNQDISRTLRKYITLT